MKPRLVALMVICMAASFLSGATSYRYWWLSKFPNASLTDGHLLVSDYQIPPGVTSLDVRIYSGGGGSGDELKRECVIVPGEKGRDGVGDAGAGMFCGHSVAILPGHAAGAKAIRLGAE
jgi:hypothetical protein